MGGGEPGNVDDGMPPAKVFTSDLGRPGWSRDDLVRQGLYLGLLGTDWAQTRTVAKNPDRYREANNLITHFTGEHPSAGQVNNIVAATAVAQTLLADQLSPEWRKVLQRLSIGAETYAAGRNRFKVGVGMTF